MSDQSSKESPAASPSQTSTQIDNNVESIKSRIVATSKLIKYVQNAKADLEKGNTLVAELEKKLKASQKLADEREKKCNELTAQLQKEKSGGSESATQSQTLLENNKTMDDLKQKMALAEDAKHRAEEALKSQKMYISQLEARSKELEEASKKASENTKITDKTRNDINRKNEEIRKANKDLASQQKTIQELRDKVAAMTDTIEALEDDAMESRVNSDMTKQEIQDSKEEFAKMETRLEFFINENASLKDENTLVKEEKKALLTQIEQLGTSTQAPRETKPHKDDNTSSESIPPQQQPQANHEGLTKALYFSEAQCDILESENKLLKAKLARLMARQRERDDIGMNDSILKRQHLLYYSPDEYDKSPSHDFALDTTLGNTQPLFYLNSAETARKLSATKITSPIASAPYPSRRSNNEMPQDTPLKKPVKRTNTGLLMPPSSVVPAKTKASGSSARAKKSQLEKFIKNPSKYQTKSTPIPLTQLERTGKEVLPHSESQKEASPANTIPLSRETTPTQSTSQPESSKTQVSPPSTVNEETIIPEHAANDPVTTKASNVAVPSYLGKRFLEDTSTDDESETMGRIAKTTKLDLSLDSLIEKLMNENKLPTKEDLEKHTADLGELMAEIVATYKRIKSMANPMAKSFKPVVMKPHGIKDVLVVQLPEHLDKKEKNVSWFLRLLVTHYPEMYDAFKHRLRSAIMSSLETKQRDSVMYRLVRLLTSLCKESNDTKFIYRFCFDICRYSEMEQQTLTFILNVAYIWGDGLALSALGDEKGSEMVLKTVQRVACHIGQRENAPAATKNLYVNIVKMTQWPENRGGLYEMTEEISKVFNSETMEQIHNTSQAAFDDLRCCIIRCLEMIFFYINDWKVTFDEYIRNKLWPILNEEVVNDIALELLGILGLFGLAKSKEEENKKGISDLIGRFERLMSLGESIPDEVKYLQKTAEKGITRLTGDAYIPLPEWV